MNTTRRKLLAYTLVLPALVGSGAAVRAGTPPVYAENGVAIDGTDPVAYFTQGAPVAGNPLIAHEWQGAVWHFATEENRAAFVADPEAFAPQFGGHCSYAVSEGYTASTVPEAWRIVDNKLYLNFSRRIQRRWEQDIPGRIASGNANWPDVLN